MSPDPKPAAGAPATKAPSKDDPNKQSSPAPDAARAEPEPHERPPVRSDDN